MESLKASPTIPDDGPYFDLEFDSSEEGDFAYRASSSSDDFLFLFSRLDEPSLPKPPTKFRLFVLRFKSTVKSPHRHRSSKCSSSGGGDESVIRRCFSKIKPLYVRVSKRCTDKLRFSGQLAPGGDKGSPPAPPSGRFARQLSGSPVENIRRRLRKCRSASAAVAAVTSPPPRRDDSLAQQEDGIESAIAHCKRSFNSDKGSDSGLVRCRSDPGGERTHQ